MGHGGYVAGLFASRTKGPVQVTLRKPTPLDAPLELVTLDEGRIELRSGDELITESQPSSLEIDIPRPPTIEAAAASEAESPSFYNDGRGVHPTCFGCGRHQPDGLKIYAGPVEVDGVRQVAAPWRPRAEFAGADGSVDPGWVLAALDCPGAFAFIAHGTRAGLLGRIVFDQYAPVVADVDHIVTGWEIDVDGRKLLAGTAIFDTDGTPLAAAKATWFQMGPR